MEGVFWAAYGPGVGSYSYLNNSVCYVQYV
jgi:hypothetical protein